MTSPSQEIPLTARNRDILLPRSQQPTAYPYPYPEPDKSSPCPHSISWRSIL